MIFSYPIDEDTLKNLTFCSDYNTAVKLRNELQNQYVFDESEGDYRKHYDSIFIHSVIMLPVKCFPLDTYRMMSGNNLEILEKIKKEVDEVLK
jgi:hypothetical protein